MADETRSVDGKTFHLFETPRDAVREIIIRKNVQHATAENLKVELQKGVLQASIKTARFLPRIRLTAD